MGNHKEIFDLTTSEGLGKVSEFLSNKKVALGLGMMFPIPSLLYYAGKAMMDKIFTTPEEQKNVVADLIKEGKKQGVEEMEIIMKDRGGLDLGANIPGDIPVDIKFHAGKDQEIVMKVKYFKS